MTEYPTESMRKLSKTDWTSDGRRLEDINCGALLRIADAVEKTAQRHTELMEQRDRYERYYLDEQIRLIYRTRQLSAARGQITKLKKQLSEAQGMKS